MGGYLIRRLLLMALTLFGMSVLIFVMLRMVPGNIADILVDAAGISDAKEKAKIAHDLGIDQPIFARVFATGCFPCGAKLSYRRYANLAVEGELAVQLGQDLSTPRIGADECRAAIASAFPVIELHHYVLRSARPSVAELIAGGGMHAGFVLAEEEPEVGLPDPESLSVWIDNQ